MTWIFLEQQVVLTEKIIWRHVSLGFGVILDQLFSMAKMHDKNTQILAGSASVRQDPSVCIFFLGMPGRRVCLGALPIHLG